MSEVHPYQGMIDSINPNSTGGGHTVPPSSLLNITLVIFMLEHRYYPVNLSLNKPELIRPVLNKNCDPTGDGDPSKLKS